MREWGAFCDNCEYCTKECISECIDRVELDPCEICFKQCSQRELISWKERHELHLKMINKMLIKF